MRVLWMRASRPKIKRKNPDFAHMLCKAGEGNRIFSCSVSQEHSKREGKDRVAMRLKAHLPKLYCVGLSVHKFWVGRDTNFVGIKSVIFFFVADADADGHL